LRCYLDTAQLDPNVAIYERLGFRLGSVGDLKDGEDQLKVTSFIESCPNADLLHDSRARSHEGGLK